MTQTVVVLTSGSSWTRPSDCPDVLDLVECWGGGGPGHSNYAGGGGGAGSYSSKSNYSIGSQTSISTQIPGTTNPGTAPVDTWFDSSSTGVLAKSGAKASGFTGGLGGQAASCIGDVKYSGGNGANYTYVVVYYPGGGGGSATKNGAGQNATPSTNSYGGNAGTGGGTHGRPPANNEEGAGGGDGAYNAVGSGSAAPGGAGSGGTTGGSGGRGQIRITYTPIPSNVVLMMCEA